MENDDYMDLISFKGGAAIEMFNRALSKVLTNVRDINTTAEAREIILKMTVVPNDNRDLVSASVAVSTKLRGQAAEKVTALLSTDPRGVVVAREHGRQRPLPLGEKNVIDMDAKGDV